jgi:hypothetical protein
MPTANQCPPPSLYLIWRRWAAGQQVGIEADVYSNTWEVGRKEWGAGRLNSYFTSRYCKYNYTSTRPFLKSGCPGSLFQAGRTSQWPSRPGVVAEIQGVTCQLLYYWLTHACSEPACPQCAHVNTISGRTSVL